MTMTIKLLSMLISLAMMLTGTYGMEAPVETARTLTVSDVTLTVNGESVTLDPTLSVGVSTDGAKALYDFAVNTEAGALFPAQISVTEEAVTALLKKADISFTVPAETINTFVDGLVENGAITMSGDPEFSAVMKVLTEDYIPAYTALLEKAMDPEYAKALSEKCNAAYDAAVDRGEGVEGEVEIDGENYPVTTYTYTLESEQLMALADTVYAADEDLAAMYNALFKLYNAMPEDSGLTGLNSFVDIGEKLGMKMTADITESIGEGDVQVMDATFTLDMAAMAQNMVETVEEEEDADDAEEIANLEPMAITTHSEQVGENSRSTAHCDYTIEDVTLTMDAEGTKSGADTKINVVMDVDAGDEGGLTYEIIGTKAGDAGNFIAEMRFEAEEDEDFTARLEFASRKDDATGGTEFSLDLNVDAADVADVVAACYVTGTKQAEGGAHSDVNVHLTDESGDMDVQFSYAMDVTTDPIEDVATGHEGIVIDDLENIEAQFEDEAVQGVLMQAMGSVMSDAGTLTQEESVQALLGLFMATEEPEVVPDKSGTEDGEYEQDEIDGDEYSYQEPEDDGELPFNVPEFSFLPEDWQASEPDVDTAYDYVSMSFMTEDYSSSMYATFMSAYEDDTPTYVMNDEGQLVPASTRVVEVQDLGDGSWSARVQQDNVNGNLYFSGDAIDLDTIAQIINGMQF